MWPLLQMLIGIFELTVNNKLNKKKFCCRIVVSGDRHSYWRNRERDCVRAIQRWKSVCRVSKSQALLSHASSFYPFGRKKNTLNSPKYFGHSRGEFPDYWKLCKFCTQRNTNEYQSNWKRSNQIIQSSLKFHWNAICSVRFFLLFSF